MATKPPRAASPEDAAALARDLVDRIAAISTPPPDAGRPRATGLAGPASGSLGLTLDLAGPRSMLENGARFVAPTLPADASLRPLKAALLRVLRIVTRDQTVFNSALLDAVRFAMQEAESFARGAASAVEEKLGERSGEAKRLREEVVEKLTGLVEKVEALESSLAAEGEARRDLLENVSALESELRRHVEAFGAEIRKADERLDALEKDRDTRFEALARRHEREDEAARLVREKAAAVEEDLRRSRLEWSALRQELKGGPSLSSATPSGTPSAADPFRAGLYADFESHFRGSEEEIRRRQAEDVSLFSGAPGPVADLGCGRGEFLEALRAAGIPGIGCDANGLFVARANEKGLAVDKADLFAWLSARKDGSLGGITAYQVVEHLPTAALFDLVELAVKKLAPEGRLLFETVNPESVYAMKWFWMDLTHVRPVPAPSLAHLMTQAGLKDVKVDFRSPVPEAEGLSLEAAKGPLAPVARLLFAPQDYAVTGVK